MLRPGAMGAGRVEGGNVPGKVYKNRKQEKLKKKGTTGFLAATRKRRNYF